jgi:flagellar motor switch protein FliG
MANRPAKDADSGNEGRRRAAAFLLAVDGDTAALILQQLSEREIAEMSEEMARLGELPGAELETVLRAYHVAASADRLDASAAVRQLFEKSFGRERGREMIDRVGRSGGSEKPFSGLAHLDAGQIMRLIGEEHPQVQALVLANLDPAVSAKVLKELGDEPRFDVVRRMAATAELPADAVRQVEQALDRRALELGRAKSPDEAKARFKTVAQLLTAGEPEITKTLIERLTQESPADASEIQSLMFVIEDILRIGDKDMQKVLSEVDKADLVLSLKAAPKEITEKILNNLSARARENIKEEIEMLGPRPLTEVEEAQKRFLQAIRAMEEKGDIKVNRGGGEVMV